MNENDFRKSVYRLVADIPRGRVMTYGQVATLCGHPRAARIVGGIAHHGPEELPWQRIVKKDGSLASGYYGGMAGHAKDLRKEGIEIRDLKIVDIGRYVWWPDD